MSDLDPLSSTRAAITNIRKGIETAREIKELGNEVNSFLDEEAKARVAWRRKQQELQRRGDMVYKEAIAEWNLVREIRDEKEKAFQQIETRFGKKGLEEVRAMEAQLKRDKDALNREYNSDRMASRKEWGYLLLIAAVIYGVLKISGAW